MLVLYVKYHKDTTIQAITAGSVEYSVFCYSKLLSICVLITMLVEYRYLGLYMQSSTMPSPVERRPINYRRFYHRILSSHLFQKFYRLRGKMT